MATAARIDVLQEVTRTVGSILKLPSAQIDVDAGFESFGVDSFAAMQLISSLSRQFGLAITPAQFMDCGSVRGLAEYVEVGSGLAIDSIGAQHDALGAAAPVEQENVSYPDTQSAVRVESRPSARFARDRVNKVPIQKLLRLIRQRYAIDLTDREFESVDAVVEELLADHSSALMRHFAIPGEQGMHQPATHQPIMQQAVIPDANAAIVTAATGPARQGFDIAIVGMSCRFPDAADPQKFWSNLVDGKNSIAEIRRCRWNWQDHYSDSIAPGRTVSRWGALLGDIDRFDAAFFGIAPEQAKLMDPQERLLYEETYKALADAGMNVRKLAGSSTGVFVGYEYLEYEQWLRNNRDRIANVPFYSSSSHAYYLANRLSFVFDLRGPSEAININCASSAVAINRACYSLLNGESSLAIAAGVSLNLFADDYIAESQYGLLSPDGTCAVFDDGANGFTRGEGIGVIVLKPLAAARRDNDRIYAVIKSCHQNNRGRASSLSEIKHEAITSVLKDCYAKAAVGAEDVSYIEVDGYATKWGDSFEFEAIRNVFGDAPARGKSCALGSLKGNIGHLEPASGIASVIKVALSLHGKRFPPTITRRTTNEFIDIEALSHPLYIADRIIPFEEIRKDARAPIRAGVSSFADSGCNVHILLEEHIDERAAAGTSGPELFVLSARSRARLDEYVQLFIDLLASADAQPPFSGMIRTLQVGREHMEQKLAIVAASSSELLQKLIIAKESNYLSQPQKGIFGSGPDGAVDSPLAALITNEMTAGWVGQGLLTGQWWQVALSWIHGVAIPWENVWADRAVQTVSLPGYPFSKDRYWIDEAGNPELTRTAYAPESPGNSDVAADSDVAAACPLEPALLPEWIFSTTPRGAEQEGSMEAAQKMELFLRQQLALQLRRSSDAVPVDQNYLELGVTSLGIISLISEINELLAVKLAPSVVFKHPDIHQFAAYLAQTYPEKIAALGMTRVTRIGKEAPNGRARQTREPEAPEAPILAQVLWHEHLNDGNYERMTF